MCNYKLRQPKKIQLQSCPRNYEEKLILKLVRIFIQASTFSGKYYQWTILSFNMTLDVANTWLVKLHSHKFLKGSTRGTLKYIVQNVPDIIIDSAHELRLMNQHMMYEVQKAIESE